MSGKARHKKGGHLLSEGVWHETRASQPGSENPSRWIPEGDFPTVWFTVLAFGMHC